MSTTKEPLLRVVLAGHNVDSHVLEEARQRGVDPDRITPETLSAAYARISRDPAPVDVLRKRAVQDVARARAQNERVVFGLGHASVAEHAVLSFDVMGVSRLGIEALEAFRLCSYTEKSQRYIRLQDDTRVPEELRRAGLEADARDLFALQARVYERLMAGILEMVADEQPELAASAAGRRQLAGMAQEDARYVTSLSVVGQLGLTANARNLEHLVRRLASHPLCEARELATAILGPARQAAPSLIRYPEPVPADREVPAALGALAFRLLADATVASVAADGAVRCLSVTPEGDLRVAAALLHCASGVSFERCLDRVRTLADADLREVFAAALRPLSVHDSLPRALEMASVQLELRVSAACFGQLKRHRMATLLPQPYDPALGVTVPPTVVRADLLLSFREAIDASEALFKRVRDRCVEAAPYVLSQAHRRRVLLSMNARELVHFSRLRLDHHAQWDIRQRAGEMLAIAREHLPLCLMTAAGKDAFDAVHGELFGKTRSRSG